MGDTVPQFDFSSSLEVHGHPALCVHAKLRNAVNFEEVESIRMISEYHVNRQSNLDFDSPVPPSREEYEEAIESLHLPEGRT